MISLGRNGLGSLNTALSSSRCWSKRDPAKIAGRQFPASVQVVKGICHCSRQPHQNVTAIAVNKSAKLCTVSTPVAMAASVTQKATVVHYGGMPLPGGLQGVFEERYNVLFPKDVTANPDLLKTVQGVMICGYEMESVNATFLDSMPALKVVSTCSVGYEHIDVAVCRERRIAVGHTPGAVDGGTADIAWTLILAAGRRLKEGHRICTAVTTTSFDPNWFGKEVYGSTLGIVGMGGVGLAVARRSVGFGMKVLYHNRHRRDAGVEEQVNAEYVADLKELVSQSDYVVCSAPASPENNGLFSRAVFSSAKRGAVFVNVGRGSLVDQDALVEHLRSGHLYAAGLDVTDPEPLPRDHPLLTMDNVTLTPHCGTTTVKTFMKMAELTLRNLEAGLLGHEVEATPPI